MSREVERRVWRLPVLGLVAALVGGAAYLDHTATAPSAARPPAPAVDLPTVAPADALSAVWYCAEGTSSPDGRADETVIVGNLSARELRATVTVMSGPDQAPQTRTLTIAPHGQQRIRVGDIEAVAEPGVVVETFGGRAVVEHELRGDSDLAIGPCTRSPSSRWYFAAGTTARGSAQYLAVFNPFSDDAVVDVSFVTDTGLEEPPGTQALAVTRHTRVSIPIQEQVPGQSAVAAFVRTRVGRVIAERTQIFDGTQGTPGLAVSLGTTQPGPRWRIPIGSTAAGVTTSVSVANFGVAPAEVHVSLAVDGSPPGLTQTVRVAGNTVVPVDVGGTLEAGSGYAVDVRADPAVEIVAEAFTVDSSDATGPGVATVIGTAFSARRWAIATGRPPEGDGFVDVVNATDHAVHVSVQTAAGVTPVGGSARLRAGERTQFKLSELGVGPRQVLVVEGDGDIVVGSEYVGGGVSGSLAVPFD